MANQICLNMIVKNEAHIIRRCLAQVRPLIHSWVIVDTGSTDGTRELVQQELAGVPGSLHERPWKDFGHNRTEALGLARESGAEYALVIDADEELVVPEGFTWPQLSADSYQTLHAFGDSRFYRTQLMRLAMPWRYVGVLHDVAVCQAARAPGRIEGLVTMVRFDSTRNKDPLDKCLRDAEVLERALDEEPSNARYVFYLAQNCRDSQQHVKAEHYYRKRAGMGGWDEEIWFSLFQIGVLRERMKRPAAQVLEAHLEAFNARPTRAEPLVALARYFRLQEQYASALVFAKTALDIPKPQDILFLDSASYTWRARDEYAIATYWLGQYEESLLATERLLAPESGLPESETERVRRNRRFALDKLGRA